ncbi:MAG: hypothetical protein KC636_10095, partial [Myxococcales bacterium]|nr:hypothetical protein [Myxococcales bacterium]
ALGQLYLGPLARPKAALRAFDRYLEGGRGDLSEEAMHGKIEALARLGARAREQAAIREFLTRFPASRYAEGLRRRVE